MLQGNESTQQYLKRLNELRDRMVEFNNMLEIEGEDCWNEESDDSFEQKGEEKLEDMHFERSPSKPFHPPIHPYAQGDSVCLGV